MLYPVGEGSCTKILALRAGTQNPSGVLCVYSKVAVRWRDFAVALQ